MVPRRPVRTKYKHLATPSYMPAHPVTDWNDAQQAHRLRVAEAKSAWVHTASPRRGPYDRSTSHGEPKANVSRDTSGCQDGEVPLATPPACVGWIKGRTFARLIRSSWVGVVDAVGAVSWSGRSGVQGGCDRSLSRRR